MHFLFIKSTRKLFLSVCGCSLILFLLFYLHATKLLESSAIRNYSGTRTILQPQLFKNATKPRLPEICFRKEGFSTARSIVFVVSEPQNIKRRQVIRSGWGQKRISLLLGSGMLFVVDETKELYTQLKLETEIFNDIILTSFSSAKPKRALSIITAMRWTSANCKKVNFVVIVPDDVVVNPFALERFLSDIRRQQIITARKRLMVNHTDPFSSSTRPATSIPNDSDHPSTKNQNDFVKSQNDVMTDTDYEGEPSRELKHFVLNVDNKPVTDEPSKIHVVTSKVEPPASEMQTTLGTSRIDPISYKEYNVYCMVWRNVTMTETKKTQWSQEKESLEFSTNRPYCAPYGFLIPTDTSEKIIHAYETDYSDSIHVHDSNFYVTGILGTYANVQHVDIKDRYAFDMGDVDEYTLFIPVGSDADVLSGSVWKMLIEAEEDVGNINRFK